jgi:hypothetical protein
MRIKKRIAQGNAITKEKKRKKYRVYAGESASCRLENGGSRVLGAGWRMEGVERWMQVGEWREYKALNAGRRMEGV